MRLPSEEPGNRSGVRLWLVPSRSSWSRTLELPRARLRRGSTRFCWARSQVRFVRWLPTAGPQYVSRWTHRPERPRLGWDMDR